MIFPPPEYDTPYRVHKNLKNCRVCEYPAHPELVRCPHTQSLCAICLADKIDDEPEEYIEFMQNDLDIPVIDIAEQGGYEP